MLENIIVVASIVVVVSLVIIGLCGFLSLAFGGMI